MQSRGRACLPLRFREPRCLPHSPPARPPRAGVTLTLAILGSSVLPLPFVFSRLGIFPGKAPCVPFLRLACPGSCTPAGAGFSQPNQLPWRHLFSVPRPGHHGRGRLSQCAGGHTAAAGGGQPGQALVRGPGRGGGRALVEGAPVSCSLLACYLPRRGGMSCDAPRCCSC